MLAIYGQAESALAAAFGRAELCGRASAFLNGLSLEMAAGQRRLRDVIHYSDQGPVPRRQTTSSRVLSQMQ